MIDLEQFKNRTPGEMLIRKTTDDSGDYVVYHYDILAKFDWGHRCLCEGIENPYDAMLWAAAPDLIEELKAARAEIERLKDWLNRGPIYLIDKECLAESMVSQDCTAHKHDTDPAVSSTHSPVTDSGDSGSIQDRPGTNNTTVPNSNTDSEG